jgi:hypothetical protein
VTTFAAKHGKTRSWEKALGRRIPVLAAWTVGSATNDYRQQAIGRSRRNLAIQPRFGDGPESTHSRRSTLWLRSLRRLLSIRG